MATKHLYKPETFDVAQDYVLAAVNDGDLYKKICRWFSEYPEASFEGNFFPHISGDLSHYYRECKNKSHIHDRDFFVLMVKQILFNHYHEHFRGSYVPYCHGLHFVEHSTKEEIQTHTETSNDDFKLMENTLETLTEFKDVPSATVHLIHGRPAKDYTEAELMELIRKAQANQAAIADLVDTSARMKKKSEQFAADIKVYVEALDNLS